MDGEISSRLAGTEPNTLKVPYSSEALCMSSSMQSPTLACVGLHSVSSLLLFLKQVPSKDPNPNYCVVLPRRLTKEETRGLHLDPVPAPWLRCAGCPFYSKHFVSSCVLIDGTTMQPSGVHEQHAVGGLAVVRSTESP